MDQGPHVDPSDSAGPPGGADPQRGRSEPPATGEASIDAVLATVAGLEERPLAEHAAVFETAQERLRHALDVSEQG